MTTLRRVDNARFDRRMGDGLQRRAQIVVLAFETHAQPNRRAPHDLHRRLHLLTGTVDQAHREFESRAGTLLKCFAAGFRGLEIDLERHAGAADVFNRAGHSIVLTIKHNGRQRHLVSDTATSTTPIVGLCQSFYLLVYHAAARSARIRIGVGLASPLPQGTVEHEASHEVTRPPYHRRCDQWYRDLRKNMNLRRTCDGLLRLR